MSSFACCRMPVVTAAAQGYCLTPAHRGAMAYIVNELNRTLPAFTESLSFTDCFLHFGHFRRAITLLAASEGARWGRDAIGQLELRSYTVDFDNFRGAEYTAGPSSGPVNPALQTLYALETPKGKARTRFLAVVGKYAEAAQRGLEPRGKFDHFRRIGPPTWPRAIHYELLDYGDRIGVEIHLESDAVLPLRLFLIDFRDRLSGLFLPLGVEWDPGWWKRRGRLRILYGDEVPPADVARGMQILIDMTYPLLNSVASTLVSSPNRSFHFGEERRTSLING